MGAVVHIFVACRPQLPDALTLNVTNSTNTTSPWFLYLSNVTLQLPQSDYAALLSAAMRGSAWKTGAVNTAPLLRGISRLVLAANQQQALTLRTCSLLLDAYEGFGVSAVQLRVRPDQPLPCQDLPQWDLHMSPLAKCDPPVALATGDTGGSGGLSKGAKLGIGLGVGLGGATALVAAVALFLWGPVRMNKGHLLGSASDSHLPGVVGGLKGEKPGLVEKGGCADHGELEIRLTVNEPSTVGSGKTSRTTPTDIEELASAAREWGAGHRVCVGGVGICAVRTTRAAAHMLQSHVNTPRQALPPLGHAATHPCTRQFELGAIQACGLGFNVPACRVRLRRVRRLW